MKSIKDQLSSKLQQEGLLVGTAEKKAGLAVGTISKIVQGKSKNPAIQTLLPLAKLLNCNIEELLSDETFVAQISLASVSDKKAVQRPMDIELFLKVIASLSKIQSKSKSKLSPKQFLEIAIEAYFVLHGKNIGDGFDEFVFLLLKKRLS